MSTHYVVIQSVAGVAAEGAAVEISTPNGGTFTFTLYNSAGGQITTFQVATNADKFASTASHTANLFSLTNYASARLVAQLNGVDSSAVLRHTTTGINNTFTRLAAIPKSTQALASTFSFPVGNLGTAARALVGNPNAQQITVALRYGAPGSAVVSNTSVAANGFALIALTNNDANVILSSTSSFTAQVLIENGANPFMETCILP